jgi:repressor LexA|tara:strand:- start:2380 stop:2985 length:606 start_codon:yes stop_codon:yes gene_type:complete
MAILTRAQRRTLDFLSRFIGERGEAPLLDEIARGIGIHSRGVVHRYLKALEEAGLIRIHPRRHRGIELMGGRESVLALPLAGRIAAGQPIEAIEGQEEISLADFFLGPGRFALRVTGDSMVEAGILDGDTVIIKACQTAEEEAIVVALIDGEEATLKRLKRERDGSITLLPENRALKPMHYPAERVAIQGVVVGQMRRYEG